MYSLRQRVGLVLGPLAFISILMLPLPDGLSPEALKVAAIATLMATWWITEAIPIPATSLLPIALYPSLGVMKSAQATPSYANHLIFLFMGGFLLAIAMERWNLHRRIALHTIRIVGVGPDRIILGFMVATAFLSMWVSNTATTMMMVPIGLAIIKQTLSALEENPVNGVSSQPEQFNFGISLMLGICFSASIGGVGTLIGTPPNTVLAGMMENIYGQSIGFAEWMSFGVPLAVVMLAVAWLILVKLVYPSGLKSLPGGQALIDQQLHDIGKISREEKLVLLIFLLTASGWILRGFVKPPMIHDATIAIIGALLLFMVPVDLKKGRFLLDWESALKLPWGVILLFGGGLALAKGFADTGLTEWIGSQLSALSDLDLVLFIGVVVLLTLFLTEITSNTATATLLIPVMAAVSGSMGVHPFGPMFGAAVAASFAFMLPVATPPNAVVYGSGFVSINQMAKAGFWVNLVGAAAITLFIAWILPVLWGIDLASTPAWVR
ncbi:SLC13 family permease [Marinobacterium jannaschii]|uniref:SLC13 family permease n=1 Tax=Marinobacterium jannaschii TaxID=64970 RepID=UPI0004821B45|nr:DASS family sodium-coupled anion symporter [Marinobacterium jannaschii]